MDDVGKFVARRAGNVEAYAFDKIGVTDIPKEPTFVYYSGKNVQTFFGKMKEHKRYRITFNKDRTKVFFT